MGRRPPNGRWPGGPICGSSPSRCSARRAIIRAWCRPGRGDFLLKDSDIGDVIEAVDAVMSGGSYFSPQLLSSLTGRMRTRDDVPDEQLSVREREILVAVCRGLSNQEIADELFISKRTVDKHRANILEKTGCKNTASLVVYAIRNGIVEI